MKDNFLFLGFAIPDLEMEEVFKTDKFPSVQTHKFNWNLIKAMESCNKFKFTYISARPISDYPNYPKKQIHGKKWTEYLFDKELTFREIPFINSSILKVITRFLSGMFYSFVDFHKEKNKKGVIVYSVHIPFMAIGYVMSRLYKIDYITIWTDPPAVSNSRESLIKSKLRNFELLISKFLMKKSTKTIALTKHLAEDFAPLKPYLVIEGIIDKSDANTLNRENNDDIIKIVYTGSLEKRYGIKNIVEGFNLIEEKNIKLEIYGRGDYEDELKNMCLKNKNIKYRGFVQADKILEIQRNATFLINARCADDDYVKYSFPSKTLEYMLSGSPLITTMLPGIPKEYKDYFIILEDNNPETIKQTILKSTNLDKEERISIGLKAIKFAKSKSYEKQGEKIIHFLNEGKGEDKI